MEFSKNLVDSFLKQDNEKLRASYEKCLGIARENYANTDFKYVASIINEELLSFTHIDYVTRGLFNEFIELLKSDYPDDILVFIKNNEKDEYFLLYILARTIELYGNFDSSVMGLYKSSLLKNQDFKLPLARIINELMKHPVENLNILLPLFEGIDGRDTVDTGFLIFYLRFICTFKTYNNIDFARGFDNLLWLISERKDSLARYAYMDGGFDEKALQEICVLYRYLAEMIKFFNPALAIAFLQEGKNYVDEQANTHQHDDNFEFFYRNLNEMSLLQIKQKLFDSFGRESPCELSQVVEEMFSHLYGNFLYAKENKKLLNDYYRHVTVILMEAGRYMVIDKIINNNYKANDRAKLCLDNALELADGINNQYHLILFKSQINYWRALYYYSTRNYNKAEDILNKALEEANDREVSLDDIHLLASHVKKYGGKAQRMKLK